MTEQPQDKKPKLQDLPDETKRTILVAAIIIIMLPIAAGWLIALKSSIAASTQKKDETWTSLQKDLNNFINNTQQASAQVSEKLNELNNSNVNSSNTPNANISSNDLQKIKDKLQAENLTTNWQNYSNQIYGFSLKYPSTIMAVAINDSTNLVNFESITDNNIILSIKKYNFINDFSHEAQVKQYWQKSNYYLVAFDYANSSTTNSMLNTLKFSE